MLATLASNRPHSVGLYPECAACHRCTPARTWTDDNQDPRQGAYTVRKPSRMHTGVRFISPAAHSSWNTSDGSSCWLLQRQRWSPLQQMVSHGRSPGSEAQHDTMKC